MPSEPWCTLCNRWAAVAALGLALGAALALQACAPDKTPPCVPQLDGVLAPNNATLKTVNDEVASIEQTRPSVEDLRKLILADGAKFGLKPADLRGYTENILARSPSQPGPELSAPVPAPSASPAPTGAAATAQPPYPLHESIVAFVTHKQAASFAQNHDGLGIEVTKSKAFADGFLGFVGRHATLPAESTSSPAEAFAAYVSVYQFAVDPHGLGLTSARAKAFLDRIFYQMAHGPQIALTYMSVFNREQDYGASSAAATATAGNATCVGVP